MPLETVLAVLATVTAALATMAVSNRNPADRRRRDKCDGGGRRTHDVAECTYAARKNPPSVDPGFHLKAVRPTAPKPANTPTTTATTTRATTSPGTTRARSTAGR